MPASNSNWTFRKVGVVGAGRMGVSLAHLNSTLGLDTVLIGRPDPNHLARARKTIAASYAREVRRGRQTQAEAEAGLARVQVAGDYRWLADCDAVIEAVYEDLETKREVLAHIEAATAPRCIHLSATSSIPAGMLGANLQRPGRVIVTHYIWPAHRRELVETAAPACAEPDALEKTLALLRRQNKQPLLVKDTPGFVITRVLAAYWSEVLYLVRDGAAPPQIDTVLESFGWPIGPCRMMDTVGVSNILPFYTFVRPFLSERIDGVTLLFPAVEAGYAGHRTGKGFYVHKAGGWEPNQAMFDLIHVPGRPAPTAREIIDRSMGMILNEGAHCIAEGVVPDWRAVARALDGAFDFPRQQGGLLDYLNQVGLAELNVRFARWEQALGERFRAPDLAALPLEKRGD